MIRTVVRLSEIKGLMSPIKSLLNGTNTKNAIKASSRSSILNTKNKPDSTDSVLSKDVFMHLLEKPTTANHSVEIDLKVKSLEQFKHLEENRINTLAKQLDYILENLGSKSLQYPDKGKTVLISKLLDMTPDQIKIQIRHTKDQDQLMIILSHLIFKNELNLNYLTPIMMKLDLAKLVYVDQKLSKDRRILNGSDDPIVVIKAMVALASRYRMLGSHPIANSIIEQHLTTSWLPAISLNLLTDSNYYRNIINLVNRYTDESLMEEYVIDTRSYKFAYIFWEQHPLRSNIKEFLEKSATTANEDSLSIYEQLIIKFFTNPLISSSKESLIELRGISINSRLASKKTIKLNRFIGSLEVFLNGVRDRCHYENGSGTSDPYFDSLIQDFTNFKDVVMREENHRIKSQNAHDAHWDANFELFKN